MITNRRGAKALGKIAEAEDRIAQAEDKIYGALSDVLKLPKKPVGEPPILPSNASQKSDSKKK